MAGEEAGMKLRDKGESAARFEKYVDALASVIGHADRVETVERPTVAQ